MSESNFLQIPVGETVTVPAGTVVELHKNGLCFGVAGEGSTSDYFLTGVAGFTYVVVPS